MAVKRKPKAAPKNAKITTANIGPIKLISEAINEDFEVVKKEALEASKRDKCNYNVIFTNPTEKGEFDLRKSEFEYVKDTYFLQNRPHIKYVWKTNDVHQ